LLWQRKLTAIDLPSGQACNAIVDLVETGHTSAAGRCARSRGRGAGQGNGQGLSRARRARL